MCSAFPTCAEPWNITGSNRWAKPVLPATSCFEPTLYQTFTAATGARWSSEMISRSPLGRRDWLKSTLGTGIAGMLTQRARQGANGPRLGLRRAPGPGSDGSRLGSDGQDRQREGDDRPDQAALEDQLRGSPPVRGALPRIDAVLLPEPAEVLDTQRPERDAEPVHDLQPRHRGARREREDREADQRRDVERHQCD